MIAPSCNDEGCMRGSTAARLTAYGVSTSDETVQDKGS